MQRSVTAGSSAWQAAVGRRLGNRCRTFFRTWTGAAVWWTGAVVVAARTSGGSRAPCCWLEASICCCICVAKGQERVKHG